MKIKINDHYTAERRVTERLRVAWISHHPPGGRETRDVIRISSETVPPDYARPVWEPATISFPSNRSNDPMEVRLYIDALEWACTEMLRMNDEIKALTQ